MMDETDWANEHFYRAQRICATIARPLFDAASHWRVDSHLLLAMLAAGKVEESEEAGRYVLLGLPVEPVDSLSSELDDAVVFELVIS